MGVFPRRAGRPLQARGSSPRTWGCFCLEAVFWPHGNVFPTHVGVFRAGSPVDHRHGSLPHARGGVSTAMTPPTAKSASSPRTWGCFSRGACIARLVLVFPTHVGVFLPAKSGRRSETWSSPRTWGCFFHCSTSRDISAVFPTHVGVFLISARFRKRQACLPHARGGVSRVDYMLRIFGWSSPRTWGCFQGKGSGFCTVSVFPTHVGVFLLCRFPVWSGFGLPHARGGVS